MVRRKLLDDVAARLREQPAVVLLGARQVGKTTLARQVAAEHEAAVFLDLELDSDRARLGNPGLFLARHRDVLVVLDEVQAMPDLFTALRPEIDADRRPGRFLLLGSASGRLLRQSAESLAGRVAYLELSPFLATELARRKGATARAAIERLWLRGGFPLAYLAADDAASLRWRRDFTRTLVVRDLPGLGVGAATEALARFFRMCAHLQGQPWNASQLGLSLGGLSHTTTTRYLDFFVDALLLRRLPPFFVNVGKRLVKSPRVYVRDSGMLHALLDLGDLDALLGHPVAGPSWEGFVLEQIAAALPALGTLSYYRTAAGAEMDAVVELPDRRIGFEVKLSGAPRPTRGFFNACEDLGLTRAYVVAPVEEPYPLAESVDVLAVRDIGRVLAEGRRG
jgi:predicted AAA+ superfamily ATPase